MPIWLFTMTDPGVHLAPIRAFTLDRSECSPWTETRNDDGQLCPTRPCPKCGRVIPVKRWPVLRTGAICHRPYEVLSVVEWCGHRQELILVPDGADWFTEIPVLGEAT